MSKIDLRKCKAGDKVVLRNGKVGKYVDDGGHDIYPHRIRVAELIEEYTDKGLYLFACKDNWDIVKVIPCNEAINSSISKIQKVFVAWYHNGYEDSSARILTICNTEKLVDRAIRLHQHICKKLGSNSRETWGKTSQNLFVEKHKSFIANDLCHLDTQESNKNDKDVFLEYKIYLPSFFRKSH